jgi:hypothetical protein
MSFLDKINSSKTSAGTGAKKVNPLLKKKLEQKKDDTASTAAATKKKPLPFKKELAKPAEEEVKQEKSTAEEEAKQEEVKEVAKEEVKIENAPKSEKRAEKEQVNTKAKDKPKEAPKQAEKAPKEEKEAEPAEATEEEVIEKAEETKEAEKEEKKEPAKKPESKTTTKVNSKKKPAAKTNNKKKAEEKTNDVVDITDIPTTNMSFAEAISQITSPFVDEEWEEFKKEVQDELSAIVITDDLNPGTLKITISELSILREKIWFSYQEIKTLFESLSSKDPEGLIERIKRVNLGAGNNDMERRKAGVMACMNYPTDAGEINLYEVLDETRSRFNFLKSVLDSIQYKTDVLITMNGALKLEKDHIIRGE